MEDMMAVLREVVISWHDEPDEAYLVTVSIDERWNSLDDGFEDDDSIFFYFSNEAEFDDAKTGDGYDFKIIEWEEN
jgi:hypothetical protein